MTELPIHTPRSYALKWLLLLAGALVILVLDHLLRVRDLVNNYVLATLVLIGINIVLAVGLNVINGYAVGDFPNMIHKVHMGKELVKSGYAYQGQARFNEITYPQLLTNCVKCHDGSANAAFKTDSGDMLRSIGWTWGELPPGTFMIDEIRSGKNQGEQYATLRIRIYAGAGDGFYFRFHEFGTEHGLPARPTFYPAWKAASSVGTSSSVASTR